MYKMLRLAKNMLTFHVFHHKSFKISPPAGQRRLSAPLDPQLIKFVRFAHSPRTPAKKRRFVSLFMFLFMFLQPPNLYFLNSRTYLDAMKTSYFRTSVIWQPYTIWHLIHDLFFYKNKNLTTVSVVARKDDPAKTKTPCRFAQSVVGCANPKIKQMVLGRVIQTIDASQHQAKTRNPTSYVH
jgi:hypothetical protein